ncbi:hypothetical protein PM082_014360 [Marasmius tenuissimus]|nr:hypothetical protein PM082_014360 [Marasmius tenuissimus]
MLSSCLGRDLPVRGDANEEKLSEEPLALSTSNDPPSPCEEFRTQFTTSSKALEELDSRIRELSMSAIPTSLLEEQAREAEKKRLYAFILHPIRRLPPEILAEIFRIRTYNDVDLQWRDFPGSLNSRKFPWVPGQVCRTWRLVALSTSDLWAKVNVSWMGRVSPERAASLEWLMSLHLERAREQPLDISFYSGHLSDSPNGRLQDKILFLLCSRASQWRFARLEGDVEGFVHLCPFRGAFRSLENLEIHFWNDDWSIGSIYPFRVFEDCPSLMRFVLRGGAAILVQEENQIPWGQITHFEARETEEWIPDTREHLEVLPKLDRVEVCVLDAYYSDSRPPVLLTPNFRFLHTLVLRHARAMGVGTGIPILLTWLVIPSLRVLRFPSGFDCPVELINFLDRSQCSLEELTIAMDGEMAFAHANFGGNLIRLLESSALRSLRTFQFRGASWVNNETQQRLLDVIFETLTFGAKGNKLSMPQLQRLTIDGLTITSYPSTVRNEEALCAMVSSRCFIEPAVMAERGLCRLEDLTLWNFGENDTIPLKRSSMDRLMEISLTQGLTFNWHWGDLEWDIVDRDIPYCSLFKA